MISIICPTRDRPELFKQMIDSVKETCVTSPEIIVGIGADESDVKHNNYSYDVTGMRCLHTGLLPGVQVSNEMALMAKGDVIMCSPDDTIYLTKGWDKALQDAYDALYNKIHIFTLRDSRNEGLHIAVTKEYLKAMGYFWCPIFLHWFVDPWLKKLAQECNCYTHINDYVVQHFKPTAGDRPADETFTRIRKMGWHRRDTFVDKNCRHLFEAEKRKLTTALHLEVCDE